MKRRITRMLAGLGVAVFAVACNSATTLPAPAVAPSDLNQRFSGSSFTIDVDPAGHSTTIHHLIAADQPGMAEIDALLVFKTHARTAAHAGADSRCHKGYPYGVELVSLTWVQAYNDGSAFTGAVDAASNPRAVVCTNGVDFYLNVKGIILGGAGPAFENLSGGTWAAEAEIKESLTTGTVTAKFTYKEDAAAQ